MKTKICNIGSCKQVYTKNDIIELIFNTPILESSIIQLTNPNFPLIEIVGVIQNVHYCALFTQNPNKKISDIDLLKNIGIDINIIGLKYDIK